MNIARILAVLASVILVLAATPAHAALLHLAGKLTAHNDVATIAFTLDEAMSDFRFWTDSFQDGANFDPLAALWRADTGHLIAMSDDDAWIDSSQSYGDAGFLFSPLAAGDYLLTLTAAPNFALGGSLGDGFSFDAETPMPLFSGTHWSAWLTAARASGGGGAPLPEPPPAALLAACACAASACFALRRRPPRQR